MTEMAAANTEVREDNRAKDVQPRSEKRILPAIILCWFFFWIGAHRFYVGKPVSAVFHILTLGGLGFWALVDFFLILTGNFTDKQGNKITDWT